MSESEIQEAIKNHLARNREREFIADFQLPIVDLIRAAASTLTLGAYPMEVTVNQG